jgi:hypothetical protein
VARVSNQKANDRWRISDIWDALSGFIRGVSDPCRATILSRRAAVLWIGTLSLIGWAAILALARVIL